MGRSYMSCRQISPAVKAWRYSNVVAIVLITNSTNFAFALEACGFVGFEHYYPAPTDLDHAIWLGWQLRPSGTKAVIA